MAKKFFYKGTGSLSEKSLLHFYDNPYNFPLKKVKYKNNSFPNNCVVLLTHGTFLIHSSLRDTILYGNGCANEKGFHSDMDHKILRILKGFSDFGTSVAIRYSGIPKDKIIRHIGSRMIGDPNRAIDADDFIRDTDFYGNRVSQNPSQYRDEGEKEHKKYHDTITKKLKSIESEQAGVIAFDIHDTGVRRLAYEPKDDRFQAEAFPLITLGTRDGASCNQDILEYFASRIEYYLGIVPLLNEPYKGGYVTQRHGENYREHLEKSGERTGKRNVIQVEIGKFLYMQESTQKIDKQRIKIVGVGLRNAIADTGKKFDTSYFESL